MRRILYGQELEIRVERRYHFTHKRLELPPSLNSCSVIRGFKQQVMTQGEMLALGVLEDKSSFSSLSIVNEAVVD